MIIVCDSLVYHTTIDLYIIKVYYYSIRTEIYENKKSYYFEPSRTVFLSKCFVIDSLFVNKGAIMEKIYDIDVFTNHARINNIIHYCHIQFTIKICKNKFLRVLVFSTEKPNCLNDNFSFFISGINLNTSKIIPIPVDCIEKVLSAMENIHTNERVLNSVFLDIKSQYFAEGRTIENTQTIKINDNVKLLVSNHSQYNSVLVELQFNKHIVIKPEEIYYYACNGMDFSIHFLLKKESLDQIKSWHALSGLDLIIDKSSQGDFYPESLYCKDNSIAVSCVPSYAPTLKSVVMGNLKAENIDVFQLTDFITSVAEIGFEVNYPDDYQKIDKNWFTVVLAIEGIKIEKEFGIGNVEFINENNEEIKRIITFNDNFSNYKAFALVHVNESKLISAYREGRLQIERSLDLLINIVRDDSLFCAQSTGFTVISKRFDTIDKSIRLLEYVHIESPLTKVRLAYNLAKVDNDSPIIISNEQIEAFTEIKDIELKLIQNNKQMNKELYPLFNSLKWIRKSWESHNTDDRIISIIIALEFIVSTEKLPPIIEKKLRKEYKAFLAEKFSEHFQKNEVEVLLNKFDHAYTEPPFMKKLNALIERLCIPITDEERELIIKARKLRNNIIHGKQQEDMSGRELLLLCETVSRIAIYKIKSI